MVQPTLYTIDPALSFVDSLAEGLLDMAGGDPLALADMTVLLPNRRAQRSLQEAFLRLVSHRTTLLPAMRPIGDVEEGEIDFLGAGFGIDTSDLMPPISAERRQVILMQQVSAWGGFKGQLAPAQAWRLASELAKLMDQVDAEGLLYENLTDLVPEKLAHHWDITLQFLAIVTETWPHILAEEGVMNPVEHRDAMLGLLASLWEKKPPKGRIIAAGSTGSIPATARLLSVVARLPNGMVVLPGCDTAMDDMVWEAIDPSSPQRATHPQTAMKNLLAIMGVSRHEVASWPSKGPTESRTQFLRDALLPPALTPRWRSMPYAGMQDDRLFGHMKAIVAPTRREEADAIAVLMREVLETPGKTAALVTPDRALARHVRASLGRWDIEIDDSGGDRVLNTVPGRLLALMADCVLDNFAPAKLLALLQHPLVALGMKRSEYLESMRRLDEYVLRGVRPSGGLRGLHARASDVAKDKKAAFKAEDLAVLHKLEEALSNFITALDPSVALSSLLKQHISAAEHLVATDEKEGAAVLWAGEAGRALADGITKLIAETESMAAVDGDSYAPLLAEMLAGITVRPVWRQHPRLSIWGPLEARLQRADVMILGGLTEGVWPAEITADPWMNQAMRQEFGLPPLTRRIGQSAHDFIQASSGGTVYLTRSEKLDGSPTVPSRWWFRIEALSGRKIPEAKEYLQWAESLTKVERSFASTPPAPRPPVAVRPKKLSVTQIETWMRDPYALYAKKILRLSALDPVDDKPNAANKGTILHAALERFLKEDGPKYGEEGLARMLEAGRKVFEPFINQPAVYAFWWPRFEQIAEWFVSHEEKWTQNYEAVGIEVFGERKLAGTDFTVFAKADRLDRKKATGTITVIDYKTGNVPAEKTVAAGYAPQLPLEAWIAEAGGFAAIPAAPVSDLVFWELKGGETVQTAKRPIKDIPHSVQAAAEGLARLVEAFSREDTPYLASPSPDYTGYGDYDHLARVKEWRGGSDPFTDEEGKPS